VENKFCEELKMLTFLCRLLCIYRG